MVKDKKKNVIFIILLFIVVAVISYQFQKNKKENSFFNMGKSVSSVEQKNFFDYGVDENSSGKKL